ncbi:MAG: 30S ribosomal protein S13 [Chloroflexi bacterium]|nr:30S ribosomal protein S13 [Chloroflexota bacterium]
MALIAGVNVPDNKRLNVALRSIYGVGESRANQVADTAGIQGNPKVRDLNDEEVARVRAAVERSGYLIEGDLRREVQMNIRRLVDIGTYRGLRHRRGLPVRGQRTKTNARTKRGSRRAIANKKRISK